MDATRDTEMNTSRGANRAAERASIPGRGAARPRRHHEAREQEAAKEWVREHRDVAIIAAFALGVFIGAWMRD